MGETHSQSRLCQSRLCQSRLSQFAVYRILDANLDRAREGIRIIEEWCRFGLDSALLTEECKQLRQELGGWHSDAIRAARNTPGDAGTALSHPQEEQRATVSQVLQANLCRTQEALRVLEEYGKLYSPEMAAACKQMRYRTYSLESNLTRHRRLQTLRRSLLYLVTSPVPNLFAAVEAALQGGLTLVQYRDKTADDLVRLQTAKRLKQLCDQYEALFVINDRVDLVLAVDADGVHLGQDDLPVATARQILGDQRLIGRSTHNPDDLQRAIAEGADYIGVGPVYATPTKAGRAAAGLEYVSYAAQHAPMPWFAIGGIDANNLTEVRAAGAERVSVVRAIMEAEQPLQTTQALMSQLRSNGSAEYEG
jgi:thiamine-phosphate pyrophosphorylase